MKTEDGNIRVILKQILEVSLANRVAQEASIIFMHDKFTYKKAGFISMFYYQKSCMWS
jgi:hypothetical protein